MKEFSVDVGNWKSGNMHTIFARNEQDAYIIARRLHENLAEDKGISQIHEVISGKKLCVYDDMNGFSRTTPGSKHGDNCPWCSGELDHKAVKGQGASKCKSCGAGWFVNNTSGGAM